jgi:hypothetical protein
MFTKISKFKRITIITFSSHHITAIVTTIIAVFGTILTPDTYWTGYTCTLLFIACSAVDASLITVRTEAIL